MMLSIRMNNITNIRKAENKWVFLHGMKHQQKAYKCRRMQEEEVENKNRWIVYG